MVIIVILTQIYANADVLKNKVVALVTLLFLTLKHAHVSVKELTVKLASILMKKFVNVFALQRFAQLINTGAKIEKTLKTADVSVSLICVKKVIIGMRMSADVSVLQMIAHPVSTGTVTIAYADAHQKIVQIKFITLSTTRRLANASVLKIL